MKQKVGISFSGGESSAVMTKNFIEQNGEKYEISTTFSNTGQEHPSTLDFIHNCDEHFGFDTVWLEPVINGPGKGPTHKVVTYETAARPTTRPNPFEEYIKKHGIPGPSIPNCTTRLKEDVMYDYRRSLGWKRNEYLTAIGIRADEIDRMSTKADEKRLIYPLVEWGYKKESVKAEVRSWPFQLDLDGAHYGNCVWCWQKTDRKLMTIAVHDPHFFDFPREMEQKYAGFRTVDGHDKRYFFRKRKTVQDIFDMAEKPFLEYIDDGQLTIFDQIGYDDQLDVGGACGDSCEIGADE